MPCIQNPRAPRRRRWIAPLALLVGCAPGSMRWADGEDVLRTALVQQTVDQGLPKLTVVLSNSTFVCDLPTEPDPVEQTQALLDLATASCREGAEHVLLQLWRADGQDWVGSYPGAAEPDPSTLDVAQPRLADASWYGIHEAAVIAARDFVRTYGVPPGGARRHDHLAAGGQVRITRDTPDGLDGQFLFVDPYLRGRFRATWCEPDASLFRLIASSPVAACPAVAP